MMSFKQLTLAAGVALGFSSFASAATSSNNVAFLVNQLNSTMMNVHMNTVSLEKGTTDYDLIKEKFVSERGEEDLEYFEFEENVDSIQGSDGSSVGTATLNAATTYTLDMLSQYRPVDENDNELTPAQLVKRDANTARLLKQLAAAGAVFGFDSNGSGVCGVNFTSLLVIDVKNKVIYEFIFVYGEC